MPEFTREEKLAELRREIAMRRNVYAARVQSGKMKQAEADRHLAIMIAIARDYGGGGPLLVGGNGVEDP